jgi:diguanylate cyclase (GGDEF)-like protein/putative nucleotidyltransferase with HDIG domain/PAS domain S-box-containing protein
VRRLFPDRDAEARLAEQRDRFTSLLDVLGEHVYLAVVLEDGSLNEIFQGPGADRLLGGAEPDPEMVNWEAALHPDDRPAYDAFNEQLGRGEPAEVEYRLRGADGITRWVHDRAATRRRDDGLVEISGIVSDVTERRRMREELAETHAAMSRVVEAMDDHLFTLRVHEDGYEVVYRGPNRERLLGGRLPGDEQSWDAFLHPDDLPRWHALAARLPLGETIELEYRLCGFDGRERVVHERMRPRREADGTLLYDGVSRDVTDRRRLEDELRRSARVDALTGVHNRAHFTELAETALAEAEHGFALLDADHFKQVNDEHGHAVGDAVLVELAARLRGALGPEDQLGRWGGEEFAVLLAGVRSDDALEARCERLRLAVCARPFASGIAQTISIGAVRGQGSVDALTEAADRRLYAAKRLGRNRVALSSDAPRTATAAREPEGIGMARALAFAAGLRDEQPEAHASEVALYATLIAERLGLDEAVVWRCRLGGWLHDVGKVAIPDSILDKPGALDSAEWELMRTHPATGAGIVDRFAQLREATAAVRHHHERFDGTGYPDGLAGTAIPLEARIVAAADAYSAMTSARPYSAALTPTEAAAELRAAAGSQLDPEIVAALIDVLGPLATPASRSLRPDAA